MPFGLLALKLTDLLIFERTAVSGIGCTLFSGVCHSEVSL